MTEVKIEPWRLEYPQYSKPSGRKFVILISDMQIGHKTLSFSRQALQWRLARYLARMETIVPKGSELHVFLLGDIIHNEHVGKNVNLGELEMGAKQQIFDVAIPALATILDKFRTLSSNIKVYCVSGNHGANGRMASFTNNFDLYIYLILKQMFSKTKGIKFYISESFFLRKIISGKVWMAVHGDQIPMYMNLPYYGITKKALYWYTSLGKFDYLVLGHFHTATSLSVNNIRIFINGTWVTGDEWVLKKLGMSGSCSQYVIDITDPKTLSLQEVSLL